MSKKITDRDIELGVEKVERMNSLFDKMIVPVLFIAALAVFVFGALPRLMNRNNTEATSGNPAPITQTQRDLYERRDEYMSNMQAHLDELESAGYERLELVEGIDTVCCEINEHTQLYESYNGIANYGQIKYTGLDTCTMVSVTVISRYNYSVTVTLLDGEKINARFDTHYFVADPMLSDTDSLAQLAVLEYVSSEQLNGLINIYNSKLESLLG